MRVLVVGAGGVGSAFAPIAARRDFYEHIVFADIDEAKARSIVDRYGAGGRYSAAAIDATDTAQVVDCARANGCDAILNAADPRFVMPIFNGALEVGATYLDMAMSLSEPHPSAPHEETGKKLGDDQFAAADVWESRGQLALVGIGIEPGAADVFARYAADELFRGMDEIGVRDGANIVIEGHLFAPTFSIWTTIEECLNPPVIWEKGRGWFTTEPFSEPEVFEFPDGIGSVECVNVEHEEVLLVPRWIDWQSGDVQVRPGRRDDRRVAGPCTSWAWTGPRPYGCAGERSSPRDVVAACLPDPAELGDRMTGKTCAGTWVTGIGKDGGRREVYLYHVVDTEETWARDGAQAVVWQTAINPVIALELIANGTWSGAGVLGPEAFAPQPFLDLLNDYGSPWGMEERTPTV